MRKAFAFLFALYASISAYAQFEGHPILKEMAEMFAQGPLPGSCHAILKAPLSKIASVEETEAAWIMYDMKDGSCQLKVLGAGEQDRVDHDMEELERALKLPNVRYLQQIHTHVIKNVDYFSGTGAVYNGEIMFANREMVEARRLPGTLFEEAVEAIKSGEIPGHNMSPPSFVDFEFLIHKQLAQKSTAESYDSVVITSGGVWTYTLDSLDNAKEALRLLEEAAAYSTIYRGAHLHPNPTMAAKFRRLLDIAGEERKALLKIWQTPSLELRVPYSREALETYKASGDKSRILSEYREKVQIAKALADYLTSIGIRSSFTPFSP